MFSMTKKNGPSRLHAIRFGAFWTILLLMCPLFNRPSVILFKRMVKMSSSFILKCPGIKQASKKACRQAGRQASKQAGRQAVDNIDRSGKKCKIVVEKSLRQGL